MNSRPTFEGKKNKKVNIFYQNSFHCLENRLWLGFPFLLATPPQCQAPFPFDIGDLLLACCDYSHICYELMGTSYCFFSLSISISRLSR